MKSKSKCLGQAKVSFLRLGSHCFLVSITSSYPLCFMQNGQVHFQNVAYRKKNIYLQYFSRVHNFIECFKEAGGWHFKTLL